MYVLSVIINITIGSVTSNPKKQKLPGKYKEKTPDFEKRCDQQ